MMAASTESDFAQRLKYAETAIKAGERAKELIRYGESRSIDDPKIKETVDWVRNDDEESRIDCLMSMAQCIGAKTRTT